MLYLGYVLLRYVLIYNLEVSFNFHLTFEDISTIKCDENVHCAVKTVFYLNLELPITRTFSISLEGSSYRESTVHVNELI